MKAFVFTSFMLLTGVLQWVQTAKPEKLTSMQVDLEALQSPEGLQLERKSVREESIEVDGREVVLRHYVFRFFSQRFMGEDWWHDAHLFEPVKLPEEAKGKLFIASHVVNWRKVPGVLLEGYGRQTAARVGVAVLVFKPNPVQREFNRRTGLNSEREWQEATFDQFRESGDANVVSFAGIMKANWRAWTAAEAVFGEKFNKVILAGGSKGGLSVRAMMKYDPRIISVVSSGSIPFASPAMLRKLTARESLTPHLVEQFKIKPTDLADDTILFNLGSNDFNAHPTEARLVMEQLRGDTRIYVHPNGGHPALAPQQIGAMRLWLRHVFFGEPLPDVRQPVVEVKDDSLSFRAVISQPKGVEVVELCHAFYREKPWPGPASRERMPHKNAEWKTTPLAKREGQYTAKLETKGVDFGRLHYYIRARVRLGQVTGWLSSPVHQLKEKQ
ncbi:MAG: PhoPQ-activated protein PqaA family protein [Verrucomicrobiota bacterium]|nr:PhoPQ-activated protein PqaA family protein [Verrucomicrobiota bacterium]